MFAYRLQSDMSCLKTESCLHQVIIPVVVNCRLKVCPLFVEYWIISVSGRIFFTMEIEPLFMCSLHHPTPLGMYTYLLNNFVVISGLFRLMFSIWITSLIFIFFHCDAIRDFHWSKHNKTKSKTCFIHVYMKRKLITLQIYMNQRFF